MSVGVENECLFFTYPSGLSLASKDRKFFVIPEFDKNFNCPLLVVVFVLRNSNLSSTTNAIKSLRELRANDLNEFLERWVPFILQESSTV